MSGYKLRPHHALCIRFFEGKGYSEDFVRNMTEIIFLLGSDDPQVTPTIGADIICAACPNNTNGKCSTEEKVSRYDKSVTELCAVPSGETLRWSELSDIVFRNIIAAGRLSEICADCCWYGICSQK